MALLHHILPPPRRFKLLCLALAAVSGIAGEWAAREWILGGQVAQVEALRADGGRYIVNDFLAMNYRPEAVTSVVYGDSSNDSVPARDQDKRFITEMLRDRLAGSEISVAGLSFPGNAVDWMSSHLRYYATRYRDLDYVVVPVNLRWVSPGWRDRRQTTGTRLAYELYAAGAIRWILGVDLAYEGPRHEARMNSAVVDTVVGPVEVSHALMGADDYLERFGGSREAAKARIASVRMALSYGFILTDDDPLYTEIDRIAEICRAEEIGCLFYLPPFNLGLASQISTPIADTLKRNLAKIRRFAARRGYTLLDLSTHLEPVNFHDDYNEHVDEVGRRLIADCLAETLESLHAHKQVRGVPPRLSREQGRCRRDHTAGDCGGSGLIGEFGLDRSRRND